MNDQIIFTAEDIVYLLDAVPICFMVEGFGSLEIDDFLINISREVLPAEGEEGQILEEDAQDEGGAQRRQRSSLDLAPKDERHGQCGDREAQEEEVIDVELGDAPLDEDKRRPPDNRDEDQGREG